MKIQDNRIYTKREIGNIYFPTLSERARWRAVMNICQGEPLLYDLFHSRRNHIRGDELRRLIFLLSGTYTQT